MVSLDNDEYYNWWGSWKPYFWSTIAFIGILGWISPLNSAQVTRDFQISVTVAPSSANTEPMSTTQQYVVAKKQQGSSVLVYNAKLGTLEKHVVPTFTVTSKKQCVKSWGCFILQTLWY